MELNYKVVIGTSERMDEVESESVQVIVTSPPYWILVAFSEEGDEESKDDLSRVTRDEFNRRMGLVWKECHRVLKPGGFCVVNWEDIPTGSWIYGYPREITIVNDIVAPIEESGLYLISRWYWKKFEAGAATQKFQYLLYGNLDKNDPRACSNVAYVWAFKKRGKWTPKKLDFTKDEWKEWCDGLWRFDNPSSGAEDLPGGAVFPAELPNRCIRLYSESGDTVLDPFLGTGTTMAEAFKLSRSCIGYEILKKRIPTIKKKTTFGATNLFDQTNWELIIK